MIWGKEEIQKFKEEDEEAEAGGGKNQEKEQTQDGVKSKQRSQGPLLLGALPKPCSLDREWTERDV
jgi:hypothetical protein